jgi:hypothetical protein
MVVSFVCLERSFEMDVTRTTKRELWSSVDINCSRRGGLESSRTPEHRCQAFRTWSV